MPPLKRREFLKTVGAATATAVVPAGLMAASDPLARPNVVFILADDMGTGDVSYLNANSKIPTPNINRIGAEGIYFSDAHSPSALCTGTRYGIMTGRYSWRTRIKSGVCWGYSRHLIEPERMTIASLLKDAGYKTACFGKWHLGMDMQTTAGGPIAADHSDVDRRAYVGDIDWSRPILNGPLAVGFEHFYGIPASLDMYPYIWIVDDRFLGACTTEQDLLFYYRTDSSERFSDNMGPSHADFVAQDVLPEITRRTVDYIDNQTQGTPFFACMSLTAPHIPIVPSPQYQGISELGPYGDFCIEVDDSIGKVLDALDRNGFAENTLVIFTSDNGCAPYIGVQAMNDKGHYPSYIYRGYKSDIYEGGHRIPFLARWPARIQAGASSSETICLTDLLATLCSIVDRPIPTTAGEDSYDILPAMLGQTLDAPIREVTISTAGSGAFSIRQGRWKLEITPSSGGYTPATPEQIQQFNLPPIQLYDLDNDIAETTNVYAEYPEVVARLQALLESYQQAGRSAPV